MLARASAARAALVAFATVGVARDRRSGYSDLVLAGRFDVGVGGGGAELGGPLAVLELPRTDVAGDFTAGLTPVVIAVLAASRSVGARALVRTNRDAALADGVRRPRRRRLALLLARSGQSTSPESRHLIFVLPFFALLVALGLIDALARAHAASLVAVALVARSIAAEVAWGWRQDAAALSRASRRTRVEAREAASAWLARRPRGPTTSSSATSRSTSARGSASDDGSRAP